MRSWTQSAWPVGTAAEAAATSLRAWSARSGLSLAARSMASAERPHRRGAAPGQRWPPAAKRRARPVAGPRRRGARPAVAGRAGPGRAGGGLRHAARRVRSGRWRTGRGGGRTGRPVHRDQALPLGRCEGARIWPGAVAAAALRSGPSATAASSSAACACSGRAPNLAVMTALRRSVSGSGSEAQRRLAPGRRRPPWPVRSAP